MRFINYFYELYEKLGMVAVVLLGLFLFILMIYWAFIPFILFGIKDRLDRLKKIEADMNGVHQTLLRIERKLGDAKNDGDEVHVMPSDRIGEP